MSGTGEFRRAMSATLVRLSDSSGIVYMPDRRSSHLLPLPVVAALDQCRQPGTLEELARRIAPMLPQQSGRQTAIELVRSLARDGLLRSEAPPEAALAAPEPISRIVIPTANRAALLERIVTGVATQARRYGRAPEIVIADDTVDESSAARTRAMLGQLVRAHGVPVRYASAKDRALFAARLAEASEVPRELVDFALSGHPAVRAGSFGANRNLLQLDTVGALVLSLDDDIEWRIAKTGNGGEGLSLVANRAPWETRFFPHREAAHADVEWSDTDLLASHEVLLGRPVGALVGAAARARNLDAIEVCAHLGHSMAVGRATVAATCGGIVGDCGMASPAPYFFEGPATFHRFTRTDDDYRAAVRSREVHRFVLRPMIGHDTPFMAGVSGFDQRGLLPPFLPLGRSEDSVFGAALFSCFPDAFVGYVPTQVAHSPLESRTFAGPPLRQLGAIRLAELVATLVTAHATELHTSDASAKLRATGERLALFGELPLEDFEDNVRIPLWRRAGGLLSRTEALLRGAGPDASGWIQDLRGGLAGLRDRLDDPMYHVPDDLREGRSLDEARLLAQAIVGLYGRLLAAWGRLHDAAARLQGEGIRASSAVQPR